MDDENGTKAWLRTQEFNGPTVDAVQFLGFGVDYPEWFNDIMENAIHLEYGTYFYEDLALTVGDIFLRNRMNTIACISVDDFNRLYCTLPF